jgi:hypothetical protein
LFQSSTGRGGKRRRATVGDAPRNRPTPPADTRGMAWLVAGGLVVKVDTEAGRIVGAWRYGLRGVVPVRVYVA